MLIRISNFKLQYLKPFNHVQPINSNTSNHLTLYKGMMLIRISNFRLQYLKPFNHVQPINSNTSNHLTLYKGMNDVD